ncbi:MAG: hypothetical protein OSJ58_12255, partial [Dysosmobacter sp.]|nr:hypothetical protein [Dysosmobacter sp.]
MKKQKIRDFIESQIIFSLFCKNAKVIFGSFCCRSPRGERGLKSVYDAFMGRPLQSLPSRGARVEIATVRKEQNNTEIHS